MKRSIVRKQNFWMKDQSMALVLVFRWRYSGRWHRKLKSHLDSQFLDWRRRLEEENLKKCFRNRSKNFIITKIK